MHKETKSCKNCQTQFAIEPDDFAFYEKIAVPPPTHCPECRLIRRLLVRNERSLYKEQCSLCGVSTFSVYAPGHPFPTYCGACWFSDTWDPLSYGREYDPSKPFFEQFRELMQVAPRQAINQTNVQNAAYTNYALNVKNCYLSYSVLYESEDVYYTKNVEHSRSIFDCFGVAESEQCYNVIEGFKNYNCAFLFYSHDCIDSSFLYDCVNCRNCFLSVGLRNREYCILNEQYTKEEYVKKMQEYDRGSFQNSESYLRKLDELRLSKPHRYARLILSKNTTGDDGKNASNCQRIFSSSNLENVKDAYRCIGARESRDITNGGAFEYVYEFSNRGAEGSSRVFFCSTIVAKSFDLYYSDSCTTSSYLFGCVGLRSKKYCILNKQYDEKGYEELREKITADMTRRGEYGEFFPHELSPFAYNETIAQEYFTLTKEQALAKGYRWKDAEMRKHVVTMQAASLPDHIRDVKDSILHETIACEHNQSCTHQCTQAFKVIPQELEYYRRKNLPLPHLCPNCRHYQRLSYRNPLKLWHRRCMCTLSHPHHTEACPNEFETSYAPDRPEIVYCEQCYQQEVI